MRQLLRRVPRSVRVSDFTSIALGDRSPLSHSRLSRAVVSDFGRPANDPVEMHDFEAAVVLGPGFPANEPAGRHEF